MQEVSEDLTPWFHPCLYLHSGAELLPVRLLPLAAGESHTAIFLFVKAEALVDLAFGVCSPCLIVHATLILNSSPVGYLIGQISLQFSPPAILLMVEVYPFLCAGLQKEPVNNYNNSRTLCFQLYFTAPNLKQTIKPILEAFVGLGPAPGWLAQPFWLQPPLLPRRSPWPRACGASQDPVETSQQELAARHSPGPLLT